jgi:hypothetical protein
LIGKPSFKINNYRTGTVTENLVVVEFPKALYYCMLYYLFVYLDLFLSEGASSIKNEAITGGHDEAALILDAVTLVTPARKVFFLSLFYFFVSQLTE